MNARFARLLVSLLAVAALSLVVGLLTRRRVPEERRPQGGKGMREPRRRKIALFIGRVAALALRATVTLAAIGLGAILVLAPPDGRAPQSGDTAAASANGKTPAARTVPPSPRRTVAASPTAGPSPSPAAA